MLLPSCKSLPQTHQSLTNWKQTTATVWKRDLYTFLLILPFAIKRTQYLQKCAALRKCFIFCAAPTCGWCLCGTKLSSRKKQCCCLPYGGASSMFVQIDWYFNFLQNKLLLTCCIILIHCWGLHILEIHSNRNQNKFYVLPVKINSIWI